MERHMSSIENIVAEVAAEYRQYTDAFKVERADDVYELETAIDEIGHDKLADYFGDLIDDIQGQLSSDAANRVESEDDQEAVISAMEEWVSDNISHGGSSEAALAAFYLKGISQSDVIIAEMKAAAGAAAKP